MKKFKLFFDGACGPMNPGGYGGAGFLIKENEVTVYSDSIKLGNKTMTSNVAEYAALMAGLEWFLKKGFESNDISVFGDSNMVINQMSGKWRGPLKKSMHKPYATWAIQTQSLRPRFRNITYQWIPREQNGDADLLSQIAVDHQIQEKSLNLHCCKELDFNYRMMFS